ncbi:MAG: hypothetical protein F6K30_15030 [Cyanothece sp. SIO2G6]|nr:hypothetical protein [Cyanothece sp. SIO2G6]
MKKIKLFLASSSELKADREQFEIFIYRKCKAWFDRGIFLHLEIWEDFLDAMAAAGFMEVEPVAASPIPEGQADAGNRVTVSGDGNKTYQDVKDSTITDSSKTYHIDKTDNATLTLQKKTPAQFFQEKLQELADTESGETGLTQRFQFLANQWRRETRHLSLMSDIVLNTAYQRIIGMGTPVIPLLLQELKQQPDHFTSQHTGMYNCLAWASYVYG